MDNSYSVVFTHQLSQVCTERQFVLQTRGIASQVVAFDDGFALVVQEDFAHQAIVELSAYVDENIINKPAPSEKEPAPLAHLPALLAYAWLLCLVSVTAGFSLFGVDWYQLGRIDAAQIHHGQWWRLFTALTLHANGQHLVSNIGFGLLFLFYLSRYLGYGLAGLAVLAAGFLGNAINVYLQGTTHFSIGASTAVFGGLGLLSAYVWKMRYFSQASWPKRLGPIFGGIALLGFTGTAGDNTDIGAHLWGFASGLVLGYLLALFKDKLPISQKMQQYYGWIVLLLLIVCWGFALL